MQTERLKVTGMTCSGCTSKVSQALNGINGVSDVDVSLAAGEATVKLGLGAVRRWLHRDAYVWPWRAWRPWQRGASRGGKTRRQRRQTTSFETRVGSSTLTTGCQFL